MLKDIIAKYFEIVKEKTHEFISVNFDLIKKAALGLLVCAVLFTMIFSIGENKRARNSILELENKLSVMSNNYSQLRETVISKSIGVSEYNEFKKESLTDIGILKLLMDQYNKAVFNLKEGTKGFARLDTSTGMFFLILESSEKTGIGYKVNFRLGNPQNCVYNGAKIDVRWGRKYNREDGSLSQDEWEKTLETRSFPISNILIPGEWSNFSITVPATDPNLLEYLEIKMQAEQIIMQRSSREQE